MKFDTDAILAAKMGPNDADARTVREYLKTLLRAVWQDGESFSGKRPFGNSGWEYELYGPLVEGGFVEGEFDEDDGIVFVNEEQADAAICAAIEAL